MTGEPSTCGVGATDRTLIPNLSLSPFCGSAGEGVEGQDEGGQGEPPASPAAASRPFTVAVMQPYFAPYAGYFRLLAAADLLVLFDCVQFPRRGWVHRNRLPDRDGVLRWATVPLARAGFDAAIREVRIADGAADEIAAWRRRFPALAGAHPLADALGDPSGTLVDYVERLLAGAAAELRLPWRTVRSSALAVDPALRGQDRVLAILRMLGAGAYVNPPGGRALYDEAAFADAGITLRFLDDWQGCPASILHRLSVEPAAELAAQIRRQA